MVKSAAQATEAMILARLADGPIYMRSLQRVKPIVDRMIERGDLCRVRPAGGRGRNMVALPQQAEVKAPLSREDSLAELVANGIGVSAAGEKLGLTRGQTARCWANIKKSLGGQAR